MITGPHYCFSRQILRRARGSQSSAEPSITFLPLRCARESACSHIAISRSKPPSELKEIAGEISWLASFSKCVDKNSQIQRRLIETLAFAILRKKGPVIISLGALLLLVLALVPVASAHSVTTFKGVLADEQLNCIQSPMKAPDGIKEKDACVLHYAHFVKPGSKYVLYDPATKTTYQLDDQDLVRPSVGAKNVEITGTFDAATKAIKVKGIKVPSGS